MIEKASLIIGNNNFAVKEDKFLGYALNQSYYVPREIDVVRATTATRVNEDGLIEVAPYNLSLWSEDFSNASWVKDSATIATNVIANPVNGLTTADKWTATTDPSFIYATTPHALSTGKYTFSIYAKKNASSSLRMDLISPGFTEGAIVSFNLTNGTAGAVSQYGSANGFVATITSVGDDWYKLSLSGNIVAATYNTQMYIASGSIYIFGAQLNVGTSAKTYFPTTDRLDIARVDYTNGSKSLLVEPQRTNLLTYSEQFDNSAWAFPSNVISNVAISPSGLQNADNLIGLLARNVSLSNTTYTLSFYAKKNTSSSFTMRIDTSGIRRALYNFDTQTTTTSEISSSITPFGNGWFFCTFTFESPTSATAALYPNESSANFYLWGMQLEAGSYATSYIPTVASTVTRNADVISKTGISNLIGQTEGTMFCDVNLNSRVSFTYLALATDLTSSSNYLGIAFLANSIAFESVVGAALQANIVHSNSSTGRFKIAAAYKANDFVLYVNGVQIGTDTSGTVPACSELGLNAFATAQALNYNSVQVYKTRLTNPELAQLTTI